MVATHRRQALTHEHGGPARLLVPPVFLEIGQVVERLQFTSKEEPGSGVRDHLRG